MSDWRKTVQKIVVAVGSVIGASILFGITRWLYTNGWSKV
jgi:hypothetical protein